MPSTFCLKSRSVWGMKLQLKKQAPEDPAQHDIMLVAEPNSVPAQQEFLALIVSYLPVRHLDLYTFDNKTVNSIFVKPIDEAFSLDDWKHTTLELCNASCREIYV
jgi:hypothetical protein